VDVQDGKIVRMIPIDLDDADAQGWKIEARGGSFCPAPDHLLSPPPWLRSPWSTPGGSLIR
jgi:trimethylamine-N-oxide reductase (cytochrome c)